ncbi:MAG: hypothetical protein AAF824_20780 [Bacteroidota bacterium]
MIDSGFFWWVCLGYLLLPMCSYGQTGSNYWSTDFGTKAQLLNGAVIAGVDDNSAVYYNPAAIGVGAENGLSFSLLSPQRRVVNTNSLQVGNQNVSDFDFLPNIFVYGFKPFKSKKASLAITLFSKNEVDFSFKHNYVQALTDGSTYNGSVTFDNLIRNRWGGLGFSCEIHPNIRVGMTQFLTLFSQEQLIGINSNVFPDQQTDNPLAFIHEQVQLQRNKRFGMVSKLGFLFQTGMGEIGLNVTSPLLFSITENGSYQYSKSELSRQGEISQIGETDTDVGEVSFQTPFSIGVGLKTPINVKQLLYVSAEYFAGIATYNTLQGVQSPTTLAFSAEDNARTVLNIALGYENQLSEKFTLLAGFKTDFSQFRTDELNLSNEFAISKFQWDLYHLTLGAQITLGDFQFSSGINYVFSNGIQDPLFSPFNTHQEALGVSLNQSTKESTYEAFSLFINYSFFIQWGRQKFGSSKKKE